MFELLQGTRTLAVLCAFSMYDAPSKATRRQLPTLERVEPTLQRLQALLSSERFIAAGIQAVALLNHSKSELVEGLKGIREAVRERPGVNMVVFWSGHGNIPEKSFRLAVRDTCDPIEYEDGVGLDEVLRQSGVARVGTWTLFLDACYAGEGLGDVMDVAHALLKSESGTLRGYGALCSSAPFEKSRDSAFLDTVVGVLEQGPSAAVRAYANSVGGGGMFNPFDQLLSLSELFGAVSNEYRANPDKYRRAEPWPIQGGTVNPRVFPNPQFRKHQPSRLVENAYRPLASASDLESHFFPKALGIDDLESGWQFAGRVEATRAILGWMACPSHLPEDRLYVLTADGGTGKSALLGRLISLTDRQYRDKAQAEGWNRGHDQQAGTVPEPDRIDAALSLRNLSPQALAEHLAGLLGTGPFDNIEAFVEKAVQSYRRRDGAAPCIVLDALDEALEPSAIVFRVVHPLVQAGWKLLVATRRTARAKGANDLIADLGAVTVFELDRDQQSWNDIYAYAQGRLRPHTGLVTLADSAAKLIADRSDNKFLFARMATSSLLRKTGPITLDQLPTLVAQDATDALTRELAALDEEFRRSFARSNDGATAMLTALAWSEGEGVPIRDGIWAAMASAVSSLSGPSPEFEERHILWLLREAGRFIQESGDGEQAVYRLFHKSLVDYFKQGSFPSQREMESVDERVAGALVTCVRASRDWTYTNPYLIRHMPAHLASRPEQKGLNNLLLNFDWIQARLNLSGIQALLGDYRLCRSADPATARLHRTLTMAAHILREHPDQLIPQLLGRIAPGVPDMAPLVDGQPGANYGLPPSSQEGLNITQRLILQLPDLNIEQRGGGLIDHTLSLDGLLERARVSIRGPRWVPEFGGLSQAGALVYTLKGHEGPIRSVALSTDGRTAVSGSDDHTVRLWDAQTGQPLKTLQGHEGWVSSVALSADSRTVVSGSGDHTVRLWDAQTGQPLRTLQGHECCVSSVALSADGRTVVSGGRDNTVRLWDAQTGELLPTPQRGHSGQEGSVALSADGRTALSVSGTAGTGVRVWDAQTGRPLSTVQGQAAIDRVALSADGRTVVSGGRDNMLRLWDAQTGEPLLALQGPSTWFHSVALSADGRTVVSGIDRTVHLWDAQTGKDLLTLQGHEGVVTSVALSADGRTVVSGDVDRTILLWDAQIGQLLRTPQGHEDRVNSVSLSADGRTVVSGGRDHTVRMWDAQTGQPLRTLKGQKDGVNSVALSADGRTVVAGGDNHTVRLWDAQTGKPLRPLQGHGNRVNSVALSSDGRTVVSGSSDRTVRMWDAQTGQSTRTLRHEGGINSVALSADGRTVVAGCDDRTVRLWDARTGRPLRTLQGHGNQVNSVALSADNRIVVSGSDDRTVRLWDAQTGQLLLSLQGQGAINSVVLSANGRTVVTGSDDRTVRLWDAQTGQLLETLALDATVLAVALAERDGEAVMAAASGPSVVRLTRLLGRPGYG